MSDGRGRFASTLEEWKFSIIRTVEEKCFSLNMKAGEIRMWELFSNFLQFSGEYQMAPRSLLVGDPTRETSPRRKEVVDTQATPAISEDTEESHCSKKNDAMTREILHIMLFLPWP